MTRIAVGTWAVAVSATVGYLLVSGTAPLELVGRLVDLLRSPAGALVYVLLYAVRPIVFASSAVFSMLAGALYGPVAGAALAVTGANLSTSATYAVGRALGGVLLGRRAGAALAAGDAATSDGASVDDGRRRHSDVLLRWADRLRARSFSTVFVMRSLYLHLDLVSYVAGAARARYAAFVVATAVGATPSIVTFVLAGASLDVDDILAGRFSASSVNPWTLAASAVLLVAGLLVARHVGRRPG